MKSQQGQRRRGIIISATTAIATTMAIICTVGGSVVSTELASSSIRRGGGGDTTTKTMTTGNGEQHLNGMTRQLRHSIEHEQQHHQQQQQQPRSIQAAGDGGESGNHGGVSTRQNHNTPGRHHRKSNNDENENEQQVEQQQQQQYSWNVNPDKLQAMLAGTTTTATSDSDRQQDVTGNDDDDDVDDDVTGAANDGEEGGETLVSHRRDDGDDDDDNNNNMESMSAVFANGNEQQDVVETGEEVQGVSGEEEEIKKEEENNGDGDDDDIGIPGLSVYSLSETTPPFDGTTTTAMPLMEDIIEGAPVYFPIWSYNVQGCTSSTTPPNEYHGNDDANNEEERQYLFSNKLDCCSTWFQKLEEYEACLDEEIDLADYPVAMKEMGMEYEVVEKKRDDDDDDYDNMITLSDTAYSEEDTVPPSPLQSQPLPTHEQGYYPSNNPGDDAPVPSPQSQPLPTHEQGYFPSNYPENDAPAPYPQSQPLPTHEEGYYPASYKGDGVPTSSPQSQPSPTHEEGYYPANFDPDTPPAPSDAATTTTTVEEGKDEEDEGDAISGDSVLSDLVLEAKLKDDTIMPALKLQSSPDDGRWEITKNDHDYDGGKYVLSANTRKVILGMAANSRGITTYQGQAIMSVTIMAGPAGGVLTFGTYSNARAPIEVLQIKVDELPMIAVTSPSSEWVEHMLEIPQGKHVVSFEHISNPENLSMKELEGLGKPGSSMVDGLKYEENAEDPLEEFTSSAISEGPTSSPWSESDDEETADSEGTSSSSVATSTTLPMQNYCGKTLALIQETCYTADAPPTCNDGDGPCPEGLFCWGNIECHVPEGEVTGTMTTPPTNSTVLVITSVPTSSPTGMSSESFLDSFIFGSNEDSEPSSTNQAPVLEDDAQEQSKPVGCVEGLPPVQGLAGCCVPEPTFLGDGACDAHAPYNTAECGYDLGDCCRESCDTEAQFGCKAKEGDAYGPFGFYCIDPQYSTIDENCTSENREWIGDGVCDEEFNTQACGWDGGDCCRETCDTEFAYYECGRDEQPFNCLDPNIIHQFNYAPGKI